MIRLRRLLYIGGAFLLLLVKFAIDVIGKNIGLEIGGLSIVRELTVFVSFGLLYLVFASALKPNEQAPVRRLGLLLIVTYAVLFLCIGLSQGAIGAGFDRKNLVLLALDYPSLFLGSMLSVLLGVFAALTLRLLSDLVVFERRKGARRNFLILAGILIASSLSVVLLRPLDSSIVTTGLFILGVIMAVVNSFRLPWIVYQSKREKVFSLVYSLLLFIAFTGLNVAIARDGFVRDALLYYSYPLKQFVLLTTLFGNIYAGMAFVSTLFHLPTAEAFDRKRSEVTSLHNLSRLITQVFDFDELVDTVTSMTLQVCQAKNCWLELVQNDGGTHVVAMKNIGHEEIEFFHKGGAPGLRDEALVRQAPLIIDDIARDSRFAHLKRVRSPIASAVIMPMRSHNGLIGLLYATKDAAYGFLKDDVDVIAAFADQATVAIENSRLINESIERERLIREMMLAQEMQRKLLPQSVPQFPTMQLDALSTPAFEVGGDYYDFIHLEPHRFGMVVGDVSGKGVPAAFYMSEVKGIFQSLSRMYPSPKDFLVQANIVLSATVDRHSFISLLFCVVDVHSGLMTMARAGHCPMLHVSGDRAVYVRPGGMGLGLNADSLFGESLEEHQVQLHDGDVCVLYTDGITEARQGDEEFGFDRLRDVVRAARHGSAAEIKTIIWDAVQGFTNQHAHDDDITLVVLKWVGGKVERV